MKTFLEYIAEQGEVFASRTGSTKAVTGMSINPVEGEKEKIKAIKTLLVRGEALPSSPATGKPGQPLPSEEQLDFEMTPEEAMTSEDPRDKWRLPNLADQKEREARLKLGWGKPI